MKKIELGKIRLVQIFLGWKHGVDVSIYAKSVFSAEQMKEIREGLEAGIDVSIYDGVGDVLEAKEMKKIKDALIAGVDTRVIKLWKEQRKEYSQKFELSAISTCAKNGISIGNILEQGYDGKQIDLICRILEHYPKMEKKLFNYINPKMQYYVIKFIAWGLIFKSDVRKYHKLGRELNFEEAKELIRWHKEGFDITRYIETYSFEQIENIYYGKKQAVDVSIYESEEFNSQQMYEIRIGLEDGVDVSKFADKKYNFHQMRAIRKGLSAGVDVSIYANPKMHHTFMREVLEALIVLQKAKKYEE